MVELKTDRHEPNFFIMSFFYCYARAIAIMKLAQDQLNILQFKEETMVKQRGICDYYFAPFQIMKWFKLQSDGQLSDKEVDNLKQFIYEKKVELNKRYSFMEYVSQSEIPVGAGKLCTIPLVTVGVGSKEHKFWLPRYSAWEVRHLIDNEMFDNKDFKYKTKHREGNLDDII